MYFTSISNCLLDKDLVTPLNGCLANLQKSNQSIKPIVSLYLEKVFVTSDYQIRQPQLAPMSK
jgi:hypothetical protein